MTPGRAALVFCFASSLAACGGAAATTKTASSSAPAVAPPPPAQPPPVTEAPAGDHVVRRSVVRSAVKAGLGYFLQKVVLEDEPVRKGGQFHGFRIAALRDSGFWAGVDLQPGDVVTHVNGMPIEHPEEALEAFRALEIASELRVQYERNGAERELRFPIVDDEPQKRADASAP
jgi:type II secretory pathway component PulC